jgi:hypothetical protein
MSYLQPNPFLAGGALVTEAMVPRMGVEYLGFSEANARYLEAPSRSEVRLYA